MILLDSDHLTLSLLHTANYRDFSQIPGLRLENWQD